MLRDEEEGEGGRGRRCWPRRTTISNRRLAAVPSFLLVPFEDLGIWTAAGDLRATTTAMENGVEKRLNVDGGERRRRVSRGLSVGACLQPKASRLMMMSASKEQRQALLACRGDSALSLLRCCDATYNS